MLNELTIDEQIEIIKSKRYLLHYLTDVIYNPTIDEEIIKDNYFKIPLFTEELNNYELHLILKEQVSSTKFYDGSYFVDTKISYVELIKYLNSFFVFYKVVDEEPNDNKSEADNDNDNNDNNDNKSEADDFKHIKKCISYDEMEKYFNDNYIYYNLKTKYNYYGNKNFYKKGVKDFYCNVLNLVGALYTDNFYNVYYRSEYIKIYEPIKEPPKPSAIIDEPQIISLNMLSQESINNLIKLLQSTLKT